MIATPLEITKTQVKAKIRISSADQIAAFSTQERDTLKKMADQIVESGANVVLCQKGIADPVQFYLAKAGVFAIEDIPEKDMKYASRAVGASIINKVEDLKAADLGCAASVAEDDDVELVRINGCKNPKTVTILLRGSTQVLIDELERAVYDGVRVVIDAIEDGKFVVGGGATETELLLRVREYASTVGGRTQVAIEAFANAFESIPKQLAENSGFNPIDKLVELKAAHAKGNKNAGLNVYTGEIVDMFKAGVIEPLRVKTQAIQSATEAASMLIRVDDMMVSQKPESKAGMPPGMG
jgi:chaperonin GroEL (HSP60 family)